MSTPKEMYLNVLEARDTSSYCAFSFENEMPAMKEVSIKPQYDLMPTVVIEKQHSKKWKIFRVKKTGLSGKEITVSEDEDNGNIITTVEKAEPMGNNWKAYWIVPKDVHGTFRFK